MAEVELICAPAPTLRAILRNRLSHSARFKLEKLFALVSLAFVFSFAWGCQLRASRTVTKAIKRKSLFRQGLEDILRLLNNAYPRPDELRAFIRWLKCPIFESIFIV